MELEVWNRQFERIYIIDYFESLLWVDRFYEYGEVELILPMETSLLQWIKLDYYLYLKESDRLMIITKIATKTDMDDGDHLVVNGKSLESLLERRCVFNNWQEQTFEDQPVPRIVETVVSDAFINTGGVWSWGNGRKVNNFVVTPTPITSDIYQEKTSVTLQHDNVYDVVRTLCTDNKIGFRILLNENKQFVFSLYRGVDRSYAQNKNSYVIFSPQFDNIIDSEYTDDTSTMKNFVFCEGGGEDNSKYTVAFGYYNSTGIDRREIYISEGDIESSTSNKERKMYEKAREALKDYKHIKEFDGEVDVSQTFRYGVDFYMGDIVQVIDAYGLQGSTYVSEMVFSQDSDGISIYPKFTFVENEELIKL